MRVSFRLPTDEITRVQSDFEKSGGRPANTRSRNFNDEIRMETHSNEPLDQAKVEEHGLEYALTDLSGQANKLPPRDYRSMMDEQQRSFEELQAMNRAQHTSQMKQSQEMMANGQRSATDLLMLQSRLASNSQQFTTISNILKSRHDTRSHAIQNLK